MRARRTRTKAANRSTISPVRVSTEDQCRLCDGNAVDFETMLKIVAWLKLDLRSYITLSAKESAPAVET